MRPLLRLIKSSTSTSPTAIVSLSLIVRPSASPSRQGFSAVTASRITLNVSAPAVDGRANAAAAEVLARILGVAKTDVKVVKGERGREKVVEVVMQGKGEGVLEGVWRDLQGAVIKKG